MLRSTTLNDQSILKEIFSPDRNGWGKSTLIIVLLTVYANGFPFVSFTLLMLNPPLKSETSAAYDLASAESFKTPVSVLASVFSSARIFWSTCSQRYFKTSGELLVYVIVSVPVILR